jgi:hypothetical protein
LKFSERLTVNSENERRLIELILISRYFCEGGADKSRRRVLSFIYNEKGSSEGGQRILIGGVN